MEGICCCCDEESSSGVTDRITGKFYCCDCLSESGLDQCSDCGQVVDGLESDGLCEGCSPDRSWMGDDPDYMDSYDPNDIE